MSDHDEKVDPCPVSPDPVEERIQHRVQKDFPTLIIATCSLEAFMQETKTNPIDMLNYDFFTVMAHDLLVEFFKHPEHVPTVCQLGFIDSLGFNTISQQLKRERQVNPCDPSTCFICKE